ncbi:MAG: hypothetical protein RLZZ127_3122 [Planctomycetota bacterium]|jgi:hypothetical protein
MSLATPPARRFPLPVAPLLLALAAGLSAAEPPAMTPEQRAAWDQFIKQSGDPAQDPAARARLAAEGFYTEALARFRQAHFAEARDLVEKAITAYPAHPGAQALRQEILAVLSVRDNRLQQAAEWFRAMQEVRSQETAVRLGGLLESGRRKMAAGDYAGAEIDFDRVEVGLSAFPYQFDWGTLPAEVQRLRSEAQAKSRDEANIRTRADREAAERAARVRAETTEQALKDKVDELLRRAKTAYDRDDFRRAELDAWNAYELDRRREEARDLYLKARRAGHERFDDEYREQRAEGIARMHEEIHKDLIPQNDTLLYPVDWARRDRRKPIEIGTTREEAWMSALRDRLEQRITFEFEDKPFEEVVEFLRQVTGANIIVAPQVLSAGSIPNVTLKVKEMRFGDALKWILELTQLHYAMQDQAVFITNEPVAGSAVTRIYDVSDLVSAPQDFAGPQLGYSTAGGGGGGGGVGNLFANPGGAAEAGAGTVADINAIIERIQNATGADKWDAARGAGMQPIGNTQIIATNTTEIHQMIERVLANQRTIGSLMVTIHVSILDVNKGFYEEIGFEYHNNPAGLLGSSTQNGYFRVEDDFELAGRQYNPLPANSTSVNYTQGVNGANPRGLVAELAQSPFNFLNTDQVNMIFAASQDETDRITVQKTTMTCHNNQLAHAVFLRQFAYIAEYDVVEGNLDPTIRNLNTGEKIELRPIVSADRKYVKLEVQPASNILVGVFREEIRTLRFIGNDDAAIGFPVSYPIELPNIETRSLQATVMIPDKGSLLLGGYTAALRQQVHTGIPFLSHIPFLGRLFSRNGLYDENRRLFFLLQVEILDLAERERLQ